jgi:hypothetical protein
MLAKASQEGARRAQIAKERGAARPDLRSTPAEALGGVGSAHPDADCRTPRGTRSFPEDRPRPLSARAE